MKTIVALVALSALLAPVASATPWHTYGPRAMGMGGAQVAIAQGPLATYWNPAGLGQPNNVKGFVMPVGARGEFTGTVLEGANDLNQVASDCRAANASCTQAKIDAALSRLGQPGNGGLVDLGVGTAFNIGRLAFFVDDFAYIGLTPRVDLGNTGVGTVMNNQSKLVLRGGSFFEFGVGYGREIKESGVIVGGNLKLISGQIGYHEITLATKDPGSGGFGDFKSSAKRSVQPGIDLGVLWDIQKTYASAWWRPRVGLVARNINNPTFKQPDAAKTAGDRDRFSLHGQYRLGGAISPLNWWHLAADLDVSRNVTNVDGFLSQYLSAGTEVNVFNREWINIPLRFGLQKNIANSGSGVSWTGGFGIHLVHVTLDVGGMVSSRSTTLQSEGKSEKAPNNFAAAAQFGVQFGGHDTKETKR